MTRRHWKRLGVGLLAIVLAALAYWAIGIAPPNYGWSHNWIAIAEKPDKPVDVFFLIPTLWRRVLPFEPTLASVHDPTLRAGAPLCFEGFATAFATVGNLYAPYYRQFDAGTFLAADAATRLKLENGPTKADVLRAFDYFIQHYNHGRPFILLGHSQGADMMRYLLAEYMPAHPDVYRRMIAAYPIGYSITTDYLAANPHLKFAQGATDTGVIISYNTEAPEISAPSRLILPQALAINPINWKRDGTPAPASENLGSRFYDETTKTFIVRRGVADATVDAVRGVVICSTAPPDQYGSPLFPRGSFHFYDIPFYYFNLRANAEQRTAAFLQQQKAK